MRASAGEEGLSGFAARVWASQDPAELQALYRQKATQYGFQTFAFGEIDIARVTRSVMHVVEWPPEWFEFYMRERIFEADPLIDYIRLGHHAFTWSEMRTAGIARKQQRLIDLAAQFGWGGGLALAVARGGTRYALLSLAGARDSHLTATDRAELSTMTLLFYERFRCLKVLRGEPPAYVAGLTPREIDCLGKVACGLNDAAIAAKLGISRSTVHEHVEAGKRKLGVRTRAEAVAVGVSLGAITI